MMNESTRPAASSTRARAAAALLALLLGAGTASAGFISTPSLDSVYKQAAFGATPISVVWLAPGATIVNSALADIQSESALMQLFGLAPDGSPTVGVFFVDTIGWCGSPGTSIIGCGMFPGHTFVVDSDWAATSNGVALIAHELGHNLDLGHVNISGNLMYPSLTGATTLDNAVNANASKPGTLGQIDQVLASGLVQIDGSGNRYINLRPIAVVAVDEPGILSMFALGALLAARRRRQSGA